MKGVRVVVSVALLGVVTAFCTFMWRFALWGVDVQLVPLALAGSVTGLAVWAALTLLLGRVYCSSVCPLGTVQDILGRLGRRTRRYRYEPPRDRFRYTWLVVIVGSCIAGVTGVLLWTDPFSTFDRISEGLLWRQLMLPTGRSGIVVSCGLSFALALVTLVAVGLVSVRHGRLICNTVCPVGTSLGLVSRVSWMHFDIDTDLCTNCRECERVCKAQCIDLTDHVVDPSRCVVCFNCMSACPDNAIRYTCRHKKLSLPLMQPVKPMPSLSFRPPAATTGTTDTTTSNNTTSCNNISTFCNASSTKGCRNQTARAQAPGACSATRCASISPTDSRC